MTLDTYTRFDDALLDGWRAELVDDSSLRYVKRTCAAHGTLMSGNPPTCAVCERRAADMKASTAMQSEKLSARKQQAENEAVLVRQGENAQREMLRILGPIELLKRYHDALERFGQSPRTHQIAVLHMYEELIGLR